MRMASILAGPLLAAALTAPTAIAGESSDKKIGYISLFNSGAYNIDPIILHWKTPDGVKKSKKMGAKIGNGEAFCYDLDKGNDVPPGSEVWLVAKIEAGESENCRKDSKHIYEADNPSAWFLKMGGTTLNNNRCHNSSKDDKDYEASTTTKGNSESCEWLESY